MTFIPLNTSNSLSTNFNTITNTLTDHDTTITQIKSRWAIWTPVMTNILIGNGTLSAYYRVFGKTCFFRIHINCGTTTSIGTAISFTLPSTAAKAYLTQRFSPVGNAIAHNSGVAIFQGVPFIDNSQSNVQVWWSVTAGALTNAPPFAFGAADDLAIEGFYEIQ